MPHPPARKPGGPTRPSGEGSTMPHGLRAKGIRAVLIGLGIGLSAGILGCAGTDNKVLPPKFGSPASTSGTKTVTPGLPGAPLLPGSNPTATTPSRTQPPYTSPTSSTGPSPGAGWSQNAMPTSPAWAPRANTAVQPATPSAGPAPMSTASQPTPAQPSPSAAPATLVPPVGPVPPAVPTNGVNWGSSTAPSGRTEATTNPPPPALTDPGPVPPLPPPGAHTVQSAALPEPIAPVAPPTPRYGTSGGLGSP